MLIILISRRVRKIAKSDYWIRHVWPSVCLSVCPPARREQLGSHWADFYEKLYSNIFRISVEKIQVSLKSGKNDGTLQEDLWTFMITSRWILSRIRNVSDRCCRENPNTHFMFSNFFSRKSWRLWDNTENMSEPYRPQMTL